MLLSDSVTNLPKISAKTAANLATLEIHNIGDLLTYFPRYLQDNSQILRLDQIKVGESSVIEGYIYKFRSIRLKGRGGRTMQTGVFGDEHGTDLQLMWFNQPFLEKSIKIGEKYRIKGKLKQQANKFTFYPEAIEAVVEDKESLKLGRITPVYKLSAAVTLGWLRARMFDLIQVVQDIDDLAELAEISQHDFGFNLYQALQQIHFPDNEEEHALASKNLGLLELITLQIKIKQSLAAQPKQAAEGLSGFSNKVNEFIRSLPFTPTTDQMNVIEEILADLQTDEAGQRLVQGDVGSGKTLVAMAAAVAAASCGRQTVVLAPTTVLAVQHANNFKKLLAPLGIASELVTSNTAQNNPAPILIGTSAVLARKQNLIKNLALVIVDEQHRFGVKQREELLAPIKAASKFQPHLINLTATPIPRTLAQTLFAGLKVSTISTKPAGRLPIKTFVVPSEKRADSYNWINQQLREHVAQIYWICPLVQESEVSEAKAAETTFAELKTRYPDIAIDLLHGKLKNNQKEEALAKFNAGETQILVSTSVVEVGVDVANASIIVIEGAERFGLAQLHQLRGRVGRGEKQSWCFLFSTDSSSDLANERLEYFARHHDGLEIAMYDLQMRGPGEVYGSKQSGIPDLKIAKLDNFELIKHAGELSQKYLNRANIFTQLF